MLYNVQNTKEVLRMLFRKKIQRSCNYCSHGTKLNDGTILCVRRGVVAQDDACRKFQYDPCKRIPPKAKALDLDKYKDEDFSL